MRMPMPMWQSNSSHHVERAAALAAAVVDPELQQRHQQGRCKDGSFIFDGFSAAALT